MVVSHINYVPPDRFLLALMQLGSIKKSSFITATVSHGLAGAAELAAKLKL
jgi:hypothetical protein